MWIISIADEDCPGDGVPGKRLSPEPSGDAKFGMDVGVCHDGFGGRSGLVKRGLALSRCAVAGDAKRGRAAGSENAISTKHATAGLPASPKPV
jgi:hypothetical protein